MKKLLALLLAAAALSLTACGTQPSASAGQPQTDSQTEQTAEPSTNTDSRILIAYFSRTGNTEQLAQMIADETGGDLFAIEPETPYPEDYNTLLDTAKAEQSDNARPAVANTVENWDDYDVVFLGYPIWWGNAPMLILSFEESYDWSGKTLVPFCTSGGSGISGSLDSVTGSASGATVLDGFHVSGDSVSSAKEDVAAWLNGLNL